MARKPVIPTKPVSAEKADTGGAAPVNLTVALIGNPNSGKTTLFNNLTGSNQRVGNFGGVTVETKDGLLRYGPYRLRVVDLPGTYSLTAYSMEEIIARNYILFERPDVIVDVVDGSNLERNLYLAVQLKELETPLVIALNMADEMEKRGLQVDVDLLSDQIGAPVVPTVGTRNRGTRRLLETIIKTAQNRGDYSESPLIRYSQEIENELEKVIQPIQEYVARCGLMETQRGDSLCLSACPRWIGLKLLENDPELAGLLRDSPTRQAVLEQVQISRRHLSRIFGEEPDILIAEQRYGHVRGICRKVCRHSLQARMNLTDKIDKVLTNRLLGLPIFALLMYLTFWGVFSLGGYPTRWIEQAVGWLSLTLSALWPAGSQSLLRSLLIDGIIAGVGGVIVFLPNIMLLFSALALLEDTGYMARAAFLVDRLMKWAGLHGKSFIPMLTGFGCSVPGILGTRILENQRDRLTTILVLPLMSCGARLTIYMLIIPAFFTSPASASAVMYAIYIIGIALAMLGAKALRATVFKGESSPFVMELPPYRIPTLKAIVLHTWQRSRLYIRKAGTLILALSILLWVLANFPRLSEEKAAQLAQQKIAQVQPADPPPTEAQRAAVQPTESELRSARLNYSLAGRLGHGLEPALKPLGFDWRIGTALIGAFAAKELFVSQLGIVYSLGQSDIEEALNEPSDSVTSQKIGQNIPKDTLRLKLRENYSPLTGFCIMLFCLISTPCMATVAITRSETKSWGWALFQLAGLTAVAYLLTLLVYQAGSLLGIGVH